MVNFITGHRYSTIWTDFYKKGFQEHKKLMFTIGHALHFFIVYHKDLFCWKYSKKGSLIFVYRLSSWNYGNVKCIKIGTIKLIYIPPTGMYLHSVCRFQPSLFYVLTIKVTENKILILYWAYAVVKRYQLPNTKLHIKFFYLMYWCINL